MCTYTTNRVAKSSLSSPAAMSDSRTNVRESSVGSVTFRSVVLSSLRSMVLATHVKSILVQTCTFMVSHGASCYLCDYSRLPLLRTRILRYICLLRWLLNVAVEYIEFNLSPFISKLRLYRYLVNAPWIS